ncbi:putative prophage PSSB64-02, Orf48 [Pseudomonas coronafaciens pv. oryzae]|uniref:hypothetical protein n=1 Tax=Pseudomonas coronafaciens TaxID=53409 RepID=UPI0006B47C16|nr:hypothetical protein [Pseudomonas coronafaciens]KPB51344.1 putative prophage PSSB64-02 [Pseudomonas coronafaciens pv. oryzae]KPY06357.1 putative prophage PSSB64-02, Orf48 [Pseudomonas coronafaciens pv. oryzae]RMT01710.1 putative prophage PSSB64-02, Orf48 [Pseudomonas coronafaciens pv. oryzae]
MNAAAKVLPLKGAPETPLTPAQRTWAESSADLLVVHGADIKFKRRGQPERSVTHAEYLTALQDHLNQRQIDGEDREDLFAQLVLGNFFGRASGSLAGYLIGTQHPRGKLFEIAEGLLRPLAADGVIAQREDGEL